MTTVSVLGGGAWGTALALVSHRADNKTLLWTRDLKNAEDLNKYKENQKALPGIVLPDDLIMTSSLKEALNADIILLAVPAQTIRGLIEQIKPYISKNAYLVVCSKGIEIGTGLLMNELIYELLPETSVSVLSGPTFARDVASGQPTAATLSTKEIETSRWLASTLSSLNFRVYPSNDIIGVEVSGALKNVIAIAVGIATARGYGDSARASLITRGLAEITRLGMAKGAHPETFLGPSGVGDIVLTCTSTQSRNMSLGITIGHKNIVKEEMLKGYLLTEGVFTAKAAVELASVLDVDLPICKGINNILHHQSPIDSEIATLLSRPLKTETHSY
ncbi:MAG: NAD(P)-dependent glycerol-3-phosphate dehydrogenase [Candidatus Paracaedimonas acanthamoebae]|uniref:Glycerol-3-phosphate dehydrogenase [NAD(P)+] n=1 Tax=Candidatus Paracaedimonas acanthamoebae TaxID=244581 RepID=A0A8J7TUF2_9PROT|nr:NAD(P)-dependent glycerol-3-phosphate dehydrogenase [Candidatus Paracaedimonas acanthamoebae]